MVVTVTLLFGSTPKAGFGVLQVGGVIDAASTAILVVLAGLLLVSVVLSTGWWGRFWRRVSRGFDPLRRVHWILPAVAVVVGLEVYDFVVARLGSGTPTLVLWFVLAVYATWLFCNARVFGWLHRRQLRGAVATDGGLPMSVSSSGGNIGRLDRWGDIARILPTRC